MSFSSLDRAILEAIVYFDLFSYPLTTVEVWHNLSIKVPYREVHKVLAQSPYLKTKVQCRQGMWYLRGRDECIFERQKRYRISKHKIDIARKFVRLASRIPWIQEISACNSLGFLHARGESDIDLFIVARRGRIWSARFFSVLLAKLFGRPSLANMKDSLCLSFFATAGAHMKKLALTGEDVYFRNWLTHLLPLYRRKDISRKNGSVGNMFEKIVRALQMNIMPAHLKTMANKGTGVVISEEFLKFHDHDRREYFRKEYERKLAAVAG
ncbi:MAG: hypothetical protein Q7S48_02805 [bacterium]|nr:hypothetical protein [bacterium]